jgi:hypothetical protein
LVVNSSNLVVNSSSLVVNSSHLVVYSPCNTILCNLNSNNFVFSLHLVIQINVQVATIHLQPIHIPLQPDQKTATWVVAICEAVQNKLVA